MGRRAEHPRLAVIPVYTAEGVRRRLHQVVIALYAAAVLGMVGMVIGPALNDRAIESDPGRALATVRDVGLLRTTVDYQDEEGIYHSPPTGLMYPTGLGPGEHVWVTYSKADPDLVKVEGRRWTLSVIPALSSLVVATLIAVVAWWAVGAGFRRRMKKMEREQSA